MEETVNTLVDASFAPPHEGYLGIQAGLPFWESNRQPFTQSSAEGESTIALLETIGFRVTRKVLHGDYRAEQGTKDLGQ